MNNVYETSRGNDFANVRLTHNDFCLFLLNMINMIVCDRCASVASLDEYEKLSDI